MLDPGSLDSKLMIPRSENFHVKFKIIIIKCLIITIIDQAIATT